jgi:hypothetical protein
MALARDLARALDATSIMRECGLTPDVWQAELLIEAPSRVLLNIARQCGKSSMAAILGLHHALFSPGSLILLVSPSLRQSSELFRKVSAFYRQLEGVAQAVNESVLRLELENGSRIISLPGSEGTIRGYSGAAMVIVDEAARVEDSMMAAVRPTLATTRGKLIAMSTPWGRRGWWWREWEQGGDVWRRFTLTADQCPRIDADFLREEERALGEFLFSQEYRCQFLDPESSIFSSALIAAALDPNVQPLWS